MLLNFEDCAKKTPKIVIPTLKINYESELLHCVALENLAQLPCLEKNFAIYFYTKNYWSQHELIEYLVLQIGKVNLYVSSWSFSKNAVKRLQNMHNYELIDKLFVIYDPTTSSSQSDLFTQLKQIGEVELPNNHSKITVIESDDWAITVLGSANWSENTRFEHGAIHTRPEIAEFYKKAILDEFESRGTEGD